MWIIKDCLHLTLFLRLFFLLGRLRDAEWELFRLVVILGSLTEHSILSGRGCWMTTTGAAAAVAVTAGIMWWLDTSIAGRASTHPCDADRLQFTVAVAAPWFSATNTSEASEQTLVKFCIVSVPVSSSNLKLVQTSPSNISVKCSCSECHLTSHVPGMSTRR